MNETNRRRTFAIISHPDAGKTTLTEKLLLYGGAVRLAGTVTARKAQRATASDWMELEKQRGISISSTVLQFDYAGYHINLLDTPGHRDFSEDTYRVLTAVDAAVMVIDGARGVESQTRKLFEVCRRRGVPIFAFINKMDRPGREPLDLIDELEKVLGLHAYPVNWPLGSGLGFRGVYDRLSRCVHLFERTQGGAFKAPLDILDPRDPQIESRLFPEDFRRFTEEVDLLDGVGEAFDAQQVLSANTIPVFFGSAVNNFGVQLLLDGFLAHSPPPAPRMGPSGPVAPEGSPFTAFIFKMQANMDPRHRDRIAFARVCSGRFQRDMSVHHPRTGRTVRLSYSHKLFGQDRDIIDEAWPGDIIGLVGHAEFQIGDTLTEDPRITYDEIPYFPPECFALIHNPNPSKFKPFRKGVDQLIMEGVVQPFTVANTAHTTRLIGAVGPLQFEVLQYRLEAEYNVESQLEIMPWHLVRWIEDDEANRRRVTSTILPTNVRPGHDPAGRPVLLFPDDWTCRFYTERNPEVVLHELPTGKAEVEAAQAQATGS